MVFFSNLEKSFMLSAWEANSRIDGRKFNNFRDINFELNTKSRGHVQVTLGETKALAVVAASITRPYPERPAEGIINYFVTNSSSTRFDTSSVEEGEMEEERCARLQRLIERLFKNTRMVDAESLCIVPGERVWSLRVDLFLLSDDGAALDALSAACLAALLDFRRNETEVRDDGQVRVFTPFEKHPVPLTLHNPSLTVSMLVCGVESLQSTDLTNKINTSPTLIVDPSSLEESINQRVAFVIFGMNRKGEVAFLLREGGEAVDDSLLQSDCFFAARARATLVIDAISNIVSQRK